MRGYERATDSVGTIFMQIFLQAEFGLPRDHLSLKHLHHLCCGDDILTAATWNGLQQPVWPLAATRTSHTHLLQSLRTACGTPVMLDGACST